MASNDGWEDVPVDHGWEDVPLAPGGMSTAKAALKGVQDLPTLGWGDEAGGAEQALLSVLSKHAPQLMAKLGIDTRYASELPDRDTVYRQARDDNRAESKQAAKEHPVAYYGAGLGASIPAAAAIPGLQAAKGAGLLTRALVGGANGALQGAVAGAGNSEAQDGEGMLRDARGGAMIGGGVGAALPVGGAFGRAVAPKLSRAFRNVAVDEGRKVLTNGADQLSTRLPVSDAAVEEALDSGAIKAFGTTQGAMKRLGDLTEEQGAKYAQIVSDLEAAGVQGPHARSLAMQLAKEGKDVFRSTANESLGNLYGKQGRAIVKAAEGQPRLGLTQAENIKRTLQKAAKYDRTVSSAVNDQQKAMAYTVRQAIENAIEKQTAGATPEVQAIAGQFVPAKQRLGRLLEAEAAATRGAARGAQRTGAGWTDLPLAAAEVAAGGPGALALGPAGQAMARGFFRGRGRSAVAAGALGLSDLLGGVAPTAQPVGALQRAMAEALRRGGLTSATREDE